MSGKYVLAVDAGSGGAHILICDLRGHPVASAYREWAYDSLGEIAPLGKQFDPAAFWAIICRLIGEAVAESGLTSSDIVAVSAASQRQGVVFLDEDGHELYAGPNTDLRALAEGFAIDAEFGDEVYRITGRTPSLLFAPAKLRWFESQQPHIHERIATVLSISSWIIYRLSGKRVGELSSDSDTGLVDIHGACWSRSLLEMLQVPPGICPEIASAGTCVGEITRQAVGQTGLAPGTLVVLGGADTQAGLLGMGVTNEGQVGIVAGWSASVQMVINSPIIDPGGRIWTGCHIIPRLWVLESNAQESGGAYRWLRGLLCDTSNTAEDAYSSMDALAQQVPPGAEGVLAFIGPRAMDMSRLEPRLGGFIFPITPSVTSVEGRHLIRAALENLCFAIKANCVQLDEVSGLRAKEVNIGGGLVRSRTLAQILANVLGLPVASFDGLQVTSCGAAMCAAVGSGAYPDLQRAVKAMRPEPRLVKPDAGAVAEYAEHYRRWVYTGEWLERLNEGKG